ncbi:MAG: 16S rRNA (cytosine(1402)-N(4))-methyltransferase RsmH [Dehalococcoidia bacterium]|nr:16S rRNA (cytosine(1402)-N(4))-methyltransferase RsmH [Dehalococcoidia bacterium]
MVLEPVSAERRHASVMVDEVIAGLNVRPEGRYVDCTVGLGGHAEAILNAGSPGAELLGFDLDPAALHLAQERLAPFGRRALLVEGNFSAAAEVAREKGFVPVSGVLFDLGVSSLQLDDPGRGFSFRHEAPLDMRMSPSQELSAYDIVNHYGQDELADVIWRYGEERHSRRIARLIIASRPLRTTTELAHTVERAVGHAHGKLHPATRTFQALRIAVNRELDVLEDALREACSLLDSGNRLAVISFHSLEDRIVKNFIRFESTDCVCPPTTPVCRCGHRASLRPVGRRPIFPSDEEVQTNPRSRSARLRVAERV